VLENTQISTSNGGFGKNQGRTFSENAIRKSNSFWKKPSKFRAPILALSWFSGLILLYWMYQNTTISFLETVKWYVFFSVVFTLIPLKWIRKFAPLDFSHFLAINIIGMGPVCSGLFLTLNMVFASSPTTENHEIINFSRSKEPFENNYVVITLDHNALENQPKFRRFEYSSTLEELMKVDSISYTIQQGLFGYEVRTHYAFY
jgi:hypothetical protein